MAPLPISNRVAEPLELFSLETEVQGQIFPRGDTPSPRTPSSVGSVSPPLFPGPARQILPPAIASTDNGLPYDHTLPDYIRQISGQPTLDEVQAMSLRVLTDAGSLQQISHYTPNLRELNLEGSSLMSLRDIGCDLYHLQVLRVGRCHLFSLDGAMGLSSLRELYAPGNSITSAAPCAHLPRIRTLDLSRNMISNVESLGFLSVCRALRSIYLEGNPIARTSDINRYVQSSLPAIDYLDEVPLRLIDNEDVDNNSQNTTSNINPRDQSLVPNNSRASSADSITIQFSEETHDNVELDVSPSTSHETSVSKLTSGQVLCGNLSMMRSRKSPSIKDASHEEGTTASNRWRDTFNKFRKLHADRRQQHESMKNVVEDRGITSDSDDADDID